MNHRNLGSLFFKYFYVCLFITGLWNVVPVFLLVFIVGIGLVANQMLDKGALILPEWPSVRRNLLNWESWWIFAIIKLPALITLLATWSGEFPFSGDHDHHAAAALVGAKYWQNAFLPLAFSIGVLFVLQNKIGSLSRWWPIAVAGLVLLGAQYFKLPEYYFARYPASFYFMSSPAVLAMQFLDSANLLNAIRLTNFLALPLVLFGLRSLLVKQPIDCGFLLFGFFYFWQKDLLYYSTSSYIDFWAVCFVILAAELVVREDDRPWLPCILVGLAAIFKEQAILLLPFVWLASFQGKRKYQVPAVLTLIWSALPFVIYYWYRQGQKIPRTATLLDGDRIFAMDRLSEFAHRLLSQWGFGGLILLVAVIALALYRARSCKGSARWWLLGGALFQVLFFYSDSISVDWTGYPRFHLITYAVLGVFLIDGWTILKNKRQQAVALAAVAGLNLISLAPFINDNLNVDANRNFVEHYDSPQYYPIRTLIGQAAAARTLAYGTQIAINAPTKQFYSHSQVFNLGYRDLLMNYKLAMSPTSYDQPVCECAKGSPAVLLLSPVQKNLNLGKVDGGLVRFNQCSERIRRNCHSVYTETLSDGQVSGVLGVGKL